MKYRNAVLLNAEMYLVIALIALGCLIVFNSCAQERTDPHYKRMNFEDVQIGDTLYYTHCLETVPFIVTKNIQRNKLFWGKRRSIFGPVWFENQILTYKEYERLKE